MSLDNDPTFLALEKEYKFLRHARVRHEEEMGDLTTRTVIIFDIETTGLDPKLHEIIEFGGVKIIDGTVNEQFHALINPQGALPDVIQKMTGITPEMLASAPPLADILPKILAFLSNHLVIAHNIDFDFSFLNYQVNKNYGRGVENEKDCTLKLARLLLPHLSNHKLHTVATELRVTISERHRALGDAETTARVWQALLKLLKQRNIHSWAKLQQYYRDQAEKNQLAPF